jgi:putative transposase
MKRLQAFKFRLKTTPDVARILSCFAGSCRFVYNKSLALQKALFEKGEKKLNYAALCKELTSWRKDPATKWLSDCHSQVLQQSLKDLERAYQNFFSKRTDFPRFKRKGVADSFRYPQGIELDQANGRIYLPKIGWLRYHNSREVLGKISQVTINRRCHDWYVSIQTEREVEVPQHPSPTSVGIDVGVAQFATLSDGTIFDSINSFKMHQKKLAAYQRKMSKKTKFGQNWKKLKTKISDLHSTITNIRLDYLHKTSTIICKNHALVCIEDLRIKNMSRSAAGTKDLPGKQVKAKGGLNKSILDQGWYEFRRQLEYKQQWLGGDVIAVKAHYTSQTCPQCQYIDSTNRKTQSAFLCVKCGYQNHADYVGAINVLRAGHAQLACGEMMRLGHSMNQEPTEVTHVLVA